MPNHVTSRCTVTGPVDAIVELRSLIITTAPADHSDAGGEIFDFNAVIPMPPILLESEASSKAEMGASLILYRSESGAPFKDHAEYWSRGVREELRMARDNIADVAAAYLKAHPDCEEMGRKRLQAILETGYANWYPWALAKWGTKWGAYRYAEDDADAGAFAFRFETAWSFPVPVFRTLAAKFPSLTFDCICFDEGWNFAGRGLFRGDVQTFAEVPATDAMYEAVYGHAPERDEDDDAEDAA